MADQVRFWRRDPIRTFHRSNTTYNTIPPGHGRKYVSKTPDMKYSNVFSCEYLRFAFSFLRCSMRFNVYLFLTLLLAAPIGVFAKGTGYDFDGDNRADLSVFRPSN